MISAIVPVHNGEPYIIEAVKSVLTQTLLPDEVIVVDDGSTDRTAEALKQFGNRVIYSFQAQSGPGSARNRGVELSRGELLAFLDADDIWLPDKLEKQAQAFNEHQSLELVFGMVEQFYTEDLDEASKRAAHCADKPMPGMIPSAMMVKKEVFSKVGPFEPGLKIADFASWYMRCQDKGLCMRVLNDLVARRRLHRSNIGVTHRRNMQEYLAALKESLDRRRLKGGSNG